MAATPTPGDRNSRPTQEGASSSDGVMERLNILQLKSVLAALGEAPGGTKSDLLGRLQAYLSTKGLSYEEAVRDLNLPGREDPQDDVGPEDSASQTGTASDDMVFAVPSKRGVGGRSMSEIGSSRKLRGQSERSVVSRMSSTASRTSALERERE